VLDLFPLVKKNMKRLTLDELKAQKNVVAKLEAIKGGDDTSCHCCPKPGPVIHPWDRPKN
jgi:hypothetical protein